MYETSVHEVGSTVIAKVTAKSGSVKNLCLNNSYPNKKKLYALVSETLKYKESIDTIIENTTGLDIESVDYNLLLVVTYEFLFGKKRQLRPQCRSLIWPFRQGLLESLSALKIKSGVSENTDLVSDAAKCLVSLPRYARVNTLTSYIDDVHKKLETLGYKYVDILPENAIQDKVTYTLDADIPQLLVFSPQTDFHDNELYLDGSLILQDKASCLPAFVLNPEPDATVIDACAAPGNKTTHLAAVMVDAGSIYAFDKDSSRIKLLNKQVLKSSSKSIQVHQQDFLKVSSTDDIFNDNKINYILLDPSCSGSGMVARVDSLLETENDNKNQEKRLSALSSFQTKILNHALSFPDVNRVVYPTCSIHEEENENVVANALKNYSDIFELVEVLPSWKHRGLSTTLLKSEGPKCLRADALTDKTNGFFVALFQRKPRSLENNQANNMDIENNCDNKEIKAKLKKRKRKQKNKLPVTNSTQGSMKKIKL